MNVEHLRAGEVTVAILVRAGAPEKTTFVTADADPLQLGFILYPAGGAVQPHVHLPRERHLTVTAEVIIVQAGRCAIDLYDNQKQLVHSRELVVGDVVLLLAGGHGFRMHEATTLLEVKQGPYGGLGEKERF